MRLTLRTLLAWKDGVVAAPDRRELGDKVAASPVATALVERIDAVVSKPALGAPRVDARGLAGDPATVAQYLDNTLPEEQLEPFERVCLESDVHLAEVAACHRVLAEIEANPGLVPSLDAAGRGRLLAALAGAVPPVTKPVSPATPSGREPRPPAGDGRRRRVPWLALGTAAVALLLVAALVGVLGTSLGGRRPRSVASRPPVDGPVDAAGPRGAADTVAPAPSDGGVATAEPPGEPPRTAGEEEAAPAPVAVVVPVEPVPPATAPAALAPVAEPRPDDQPDVVVAVAGEGPLLWRAAGGGGDWAAARDGDALPAALDCVVPPGCAPEIALNGVTLRPAPRSRTVIGVDAAGEPVVEVLFGRCGVSASRPDATVHVSAAGLEGTLGGELAAGVVVEVVRRVPAGADPATTPAVITGRLATLAPGARLSVGPPAARPTREVELVPGEAFTWAADHGDAAATGQTAPATDPTASGIADGGAPWRLERAAAEALRSALARGASLEEALAELAGSRLVEERRLAASVLALLGRFDALAALLVAEAPPLALRDAQWQDMVRDDVALALARGERAVAEVRRALAVAAPPGRDELLWRLVRGPTADDTPAVAAELVELLDDESLVVRRGAAWRLAELFHPAPADLTRYRPSASADGRRDGVQWWRRLVERGTPASGGRD